MKRTYVTYTIKLSEKKTSAPPKKSSKNYAFLLQEQKPTKKCSQVVSMPIRDSLSIQRKTKLLSNFLLSLSRVYHFNPSRGLGNHS